VFCYLLGDWLVDYFVRDTSLKPLAAMISLAFAGLFLYLWGVPATHEENAPSAGRRAKMGRAVCEAIAGVWSFAGLGAFVVWLWFVDARQVSLEAMARAESSSKTLFWGATIVGSATGCFLGLRHAVSVRRSRESGRGNAADSTPGK